MICISQFRIKGIVTIVIFLYRLSIFANGIVTSLNQLFNTDDVSTLDKVCLPFLLGFWICDTCVPSCTYFWDQITKKGLNTFSVHH